MNPVSTKYIELLLHKWTCPINMMLPKPTCKSMDKQINDNFFFVVAEVVLENNQTNISLSHNKTLKKVTSI